MSESDPAAPILDLATPEVRGLMQQLRPLIREVMPQATEGVHVGWKAIYYNDTPSVMNMIVAMSPAQAHVTLSFSDGVDLPDPAKRLEGTGKRGRHVKVRSLEDVRSPEVRALLAAAAHKRGL
jgi:hypothetical protein